MVESDHIVVVVVVVAAAAGFYYISSDQTFTRGGFEGEVFFIRGEKIFHPKILSLQSNKQNSDDLCSLFLSCLSNTYRCN